MYSVGTLVTGDPLYFLATAFTKGGASNLGGYSNPQMETIIEQLRTEPDAAKRQALSRQAQEIARADVPHLYLVAAPIITAARKGKVRGFAPHPNDIYFINTALSAT